MPDSERLAQKRLAFVLVGIQSGNKNNACYFGEGIIHALGNISVLVILA